MIGKTRDLVVESGQILPDRFGQILSMMKMNSSCVKVGEIELSFSGQTFRPGLGEEILIPAGVRHAVKNVGQTTSRWYYGYKKSG